jgi:hypothetical protein
MIEYGIVAVAGATLAFGAGILALSFLVTLYGDSFDWDQEEEKSQ